MNIYVLCFGKKEFVCFSDRKEPYPNKNTFLSPNQSININTPINDFFTEVYHRTVSFDEYFKKGNNEMGVVCLIISYNQSQQTIVAKSNTVKFNACEAYKQ